jgi:magnesium chelatase subunit I
MPITVLENVVSNAERRALTAGDNMAVPRISDIYAALPAITGKVELEYEGELHGGDKVIRHLVRQAVAKVFEMHFEEEDLSQVVTWFDLGGSLRVEDTDDASTVLRKLSGIQGLLESAGALVEDGDACPAVRAAAAEFVLEGLYARRRISRSEELGFVAAEKRRAAPAQPRPGPMTGGPMETLN